MHTNGKNVWVRGGQLCALGSTRVATCRKCRVLRSSSGEGKGLRRGGDGLLCIVCQNWSLKVVKIHARNAERSGAYTAVEAERREREKVKLCGVCLCLLPQYSRVALSAHHTFHRGIVHSLSGGQAGRQEAAQAEDDRSEPVTRHASILHRNHYVHHSRTSLSLFPTLPDAKQLNEYKKEIEPRRERRGSPRCATKECSAVQFPGFAWLDVEPSVRGAALSSGSNTI